MKKNKNMDKNPENNIQLKLKVFDEKIGKMYDSDILIMKIIYVPLFVMGSLFWLFSYELESQEIFLQCAIIMLGIVLRMGRYYKININGEGLKLYDMVKGFGINKKEYVKSRRKYLLKMVMKLFVAAMILSTIGGVVSEKWSLACIYKPVLGNTLLLIWSYIDLILQI